MAFRPPSVCTIDFETFSPMPLKGKESVGAARYAEHPDTEIICMAYKFGDGPTKVWSAWAGDPFPEEVRRHAERGGKFVAHNVQFEWYVWYHKLYKDLGVPMPTRWRDTLAMAAYRGLPLALDQVGKVLRLPVQKNPRGSYLIGKLCKPRKPTKKDPSTRVWDFGLLEELELYCIDDVETEKLVYDTLGGLPVSEQKLWVFDHKINRRGVRIDMELVEAAIGVVDVLTERYECELQELTDGQVQTARQVDKMRTWLADNGLQLPNLQAETIEKTIDRIDLWLRDHPKDAGVEEAKKMRRVLQLRQDLSRSSLAKFASFKQWTCSDGRVHHILQYHAAGTGRWAGRGPQLHNLPRGFLERYAEMFGMKGRESEVMEMLVDTIKIGGEAAADLLEWSFGNPMDALVTAIRGVIIAEDDADLYVGDLAAIEAVVTAWAAGEQWKLDAFDKINRGEGYHGAPDIYCATASKILKRTVTKEADPDGRQKGKTAELAFGYQGGVNAWYNFDSSGQYSVEEIEDFRDGWRDEHPATVGLWNGLDDAAQRAVRSPGHRFRYRNIAYEMVEDAAGPWLACILPNGRRIWYYRPRIEEVQTPWGEWREAVTYEGRDNHRGGAWGRNKGYGGLWTENIVQAISRDLLVEAMVRLEQAGYPVILTVHDEIVAERKKDTGGSQEEFDRLMARVPEWIAPCPVKASGWVGHRYHKD